MKKYEVNLAVLRLLFKSARRWWYHCKLRERGEVDEARRRERRSVQDHVRYVEEATVLHVGRDGWTLYRHDGERLKQRAGCVNDLFVQAAIYAGVPVFNTNTVPTRR